MTDRRVRANLRVPGADGTALATDVYLPARLPAVTVVTRTCYGRGAHRAEGLGWAQRGFAFVVQDVRGRYDSDGVWSPYEGERADGGALAEWVVASSWSDGRVVALGGSYAAFTAWAMAISASTVVRAVVSQVPAMGLHKVKFDPSGVLRLAEHVHWWLQHAESRTSRADILRAHPNVLDRLPVAELARWFWPELSRWWSSVRPWAMGEATEPDEAITDAELAALDMPTMHIGGWHDLLRTETLRQWSIVGRSHAPRPTSELLLGPWGHEPPALGESIVDWITAALAEPRNGARSQVRLVGGTKWHEWLAGTETGVQLRAAGPRSFRYDPADPFPSSAFECDRQALDKRTDAVRFRGTALSKPVHMMGNPRVRLAGTVSADSADWVVRINERTAGGGVYTRATGVAVAKHGHREHEIELAPTGVVLAAGSVIELEVTGSDFPDLARNLGTGDRYHDAAGISGEQTVHEAELTLPVVAK